VNELLEQYQAAEAEMQRCALELRKEERGVWCATPGELRRDRADYLGRLAAIIRSGAEYPDEVLRMCAGDVDVRYLSCPCVRGERDRCIAHREEGGRDSNISSIDEGSQPVSVPEMIPGPDADLAGGRGREWRVAWNLERDRKHSVAELTEEGLKMVIGGLERWQAYAIVAVLHPPFSE
jgi:hypothetical protein